MKLIEKLPSFYHNSNIAIAIQEAFGSESEILEDEILDFINQLFVETATWGLGLWEEFVDIPIDEKLSYELRRARIKTKITRFIPALHEQQLKDLIKHYFNEVDIVDYPRENRFEVVFGTYGIIGENLQYAVNDLEDIKPAHLDFSVAIKYISNIVITKMFTKWQSDLLPLCGTLECASDIVEYVYTIGRKFDNNIDRTVNNLFSEKFVYASEEEFIIGNGKTYIESITNYINNMLSDEFKIASESIYAGEVN